MSKIKTSTEIQKMVEDDNVSKQDIANLIHQFRDDNWWVTPFIQNQKRIMATVATIFSLGVGSGHYGLPAIERFRSHHRRPPPPPIEQIQQDLPRPDIDEYRDEHPPVDDGGR